jgi:hypothetical protein
MGTTLAFLIQSYVDTKAAVLRIALKHNLTVCFDPEMRVEIKCGRGFVEEVDNEAEAMDDDAEGRGGEGGARDAGEQGLGKHPRG